jgi:hypothetical protein
MPDQSPGLRQAILTTNAGVFALMTESAAAYKIGLG